jgi:predicted dehydrogenase
VNETVAVVGTGQPRPERDDDSGWGMAYHHATGYDRVGGCDLVACADVVEANATAFAEANGIPADHAHTDHVAMLDAVGPDVVSVCTPPPTHADIAVDCARAGVDAVHCEKPMAATWGDARRMALASWRRDVQLTFDHQRRFGPAVRHAKRLLDDGVVGDLDRVAVDAGDLFDWGTHVVDIAGFLADEAEPAWVLAAVDAREPFENFGVPHETQGLAHWRYETGVDGLATTGDGSTMDALVRVEGTAGTIEIPAARADELRVRGPDGVETPAVPDADAHSQWHDLVAVGVAEAMDALREHREPEIGAAGALRTTEILFGAYESVRRQERVEFPLTTDDHPLATMLADRADD